MSTFAPPPALNASVPIVGQPFRFTGCTALPTLACSCGHADGLTLVAQYAGNGRWMGVASQCPGCGTSYIVRAISTDASGQLQISVDVARSPREPSVP